MLGSLFLVPMPAPWHRPTNREFPSLVWRTPAIRVLLLYEPKFLRAHVLSSSFHDRRERAGGLALRNLWSCTWSPAKKVCDFRYVTSSGTSADRFHCNIKGHHYPSLSRTGTVAGFQRVWQSLSYILEIDILVKSYLPTASLIGFLNIDLLYFKFLARQRSETRIAI